MIQAVKETTPINDKQRSRFPADPIGYLYIYHGSGAGVSLKT